MGDFGHWIFLTSIPFEIWFICKIFGFHDHDYEEWQLFRENSFYSVVKQQITAIFVFKTVVTVLEAHAYTRDM